MAIFDVELWLEVEVERGRQCCGSKIVVGRQ